MDPIKLGMSGDAPKISIDDLIKANMMQMLFAQATIHILEEAKSNEEELKLYREREQRKLERLYE